jgi:hypothetical protein
MKQIGSIEKITKFNTKFDKSFVWQLAEMLAVSPNFHGQFGAQPETFTTHTTTLSLISFGH